MADPHHPIRVALLDDSPLFRQAVASMIARDPRLRVAALATDAPALLEALALTPCDLVIMDVQLHDADGMMVIERIHRLHAEVRIVVLTSVERAPVVRAALHAGADGYLVKRQQPEELVESIVRAGAGRTVVAPHVAASLIAAGGRDADGGGGAGATLAANELDVLRLVARGATDLQIARELYVSPRTVQNQLARIREKAGVRRRTELVRWAADNAIV